jgi:DNA-binding MarR family transcriptional regulator
MDNERRVDEILNVAELREQLAAALRELDRLRRVPALADATAAERVEAILKARRLRGRFFDSQLFADPAWDMLLELYAADLKGVRISVTQLCIGAAVPPTTALRWMRSLEQQGLLGRSADHFDARRRYVFLLPGARDTMTELLTACPPAESLL